MFEIIKIGMSSVSVESSINIWGVKLDIMFRGCKFF